MKKLWAFIRVPYMNPTILGLYWGSLYEYESYYLGVIGPGFLNQVPTLVVITTSQDGL